MTTALSPIDAAKLAVAEWASTIVASGMRVGLGTGSTAAFLVKCLGERVRAEGLDIVCVPTSVATAELAREEGIRLATLDEAGWLDLTVDGADEFDPDLNLIKGAGGALLREKVVATASDRMIAIVDASKQVQALGAFPLPVEVLGFGMDVTKALLEKVLETQDVDGHRIEPRRRNGKILTTDEGNHILDLHLDRIGNARDLALALNQIPGVVENGLFIGMCDTIILGNVDGTVETILAPRGNSETHRTERTGGDRPAAAK
ncbi:MAG: ribose-5-phosphate isomerase RpiA [Boseongicola sp. SB0667_bin_21]|nr:ribose-5-phosphate isomerase RpiA [Boseongicola sp. SB0667_bin_21]